MTDHLAWTLGALGLVVAVFAVAILIVPNDLPREKK